MPRTKYMVAFGLYALLKNEEGMSRCLEINKHSVIMSHLLVTLIIVTLCRSHFQSHFLVTLSSFNHIFSHTFIHTFSHILVTLQNTLYLIHPFFKVTLSVTFSFTFLSDNFVTTLSHTFSHIITDSNLVSHLQSHSARMEPIWLMLVHSDNIFSFFVNKDAFQ